MPMVWRFIILASVIFGFTCAARAGDAPTQRTFLFTYSGQVEGVKPGAQVHLWLPMPANDDSQHATLVKAALYHLPIDEHFVQAKKVGPNMMVDIISAADKDGNLSFSLTYRVARRELGQTPIAKDADLQPYLAPDKLIPVVGKPTRVMLAGKTVPADPLSAARFLYDLVDDSMQYRKDKPGWGRGDADWACDSHFGNCTDFHSLFISLARTQHLPAMFEIGFAIPAKIGSGAVAGYHCWAEFAVAGNWVPVDISEANLDPSKRDYYFGHLDANRVLFTIGRDLNLAPRQKGPPLNFFIYPYAEVEGQPWPADKITHAFSYEDVK